MIGGLLTALAWLILQIFYFKAQSGVTMYNVIYGTFAAFPFFLIWLHASWMIVLFGAELTYAVQNNRIYRLEQVENVSTPASLSALGLSVLFEIARQYKANKGPWSIDSFSDRHHVSRRLTETVLQSLQDKGLIGEMVDQPGKYVPAGDPSKIHMAEMEEAFLDTPDPVILKILNESSPVLEKWIQQYQKHLKSGVAEQTLAELMNADIKESTKSPS
jgi:membrane protein